LLVQDCLDRGLLCSVQGLRSSSGQDSATYHSHAVACRADKQTGQGFREQTSPRERKGQNLTDGITQRYCTADGGGKGGPFCFRIPSGRTAAWVGVISTLDVFAPHQRPLFSRPRSNYFIQVLPVSEECVCLRQQIQPLPPKFSLPVAVTWSPSRP
jgi:hypothetical protein